MNERIKLLAEQAAENYTETFKWEYLPDIDRNIFEKFAELIIIECVNAVMDGTKEGDHYAQKIEQHFDNSTGGILHFGVEE